MYHSHIKKTLLRLPCVIVLLLFYSSHGQDTHKNLKKGVKFFETGNYVKAIELFEALTDSSGNHNNEIATYLAQCHLELLEPESALSVLQSVDEPNNFNIFLQAESCYHSEQFDKALTLTSQLSDTSYFDIEELKERILIAKSSYSEGKGYIIQNFGDKINSKEREYSAVMFNDYNKLLFTSRRKGVKSADVDGLDYENIFITSIDSSNNWLPAEPLKMAIEEEKTHDATVQVFNQGQKLISYHNGNLFVSALKDGTWTMEGKMEIHKYDGADTHCFISDDEQSIIFASDFEYPGSDLDLYYSEKDNQNKWSTPIPIKELNTDFDEDSPFLSKEGTLYFSSRGHNSIGGYDIFKSAFDSTNNVWQKPINLEYPINTVSEDTYYSTDGKLGYLSSSRTNGYGSLDLYRVYLFNKVKIIGYVMDNESNQPIPDVQIDLEYDSLYFRSYTDINGKYEMFVPVNKNMKVTFTKDSTNLHEDIYIVNVFFKDKNNNGYNFQINNTKDHPSAIANFTTPKSVQELKIDVKNDLKPNSNILSVPKYLEKHWLDSATKSNYTKRIEDLKNATATGHQEKQELDTIKQTIYFDFDSYSVSKNSIELLDKIVKKKISGNIKISGHTDTVGSESYNIKLSILRACAVFDYLVSKGVNPDQMIYKGYGFTIPTGTNSSTVPSEKLRRTEITYYE